MAKMEKLLSLVREPSAKNWMHNMLHNIRTKNIPYIHVKLLIVLTQQILCVVKTLFFVGECCSTLFLERFELTIVSPILFLLELVLCRFFVSISFCSPFFACRAKMRWSIISLNCKYILMLYMWTWKSWEVSKESTCVVLYRFFKKDISSNKQCFYSHCALLFVPWT